MEYKDVFKRAADCHDLSEEDRQLVWDRVKNLECPWNAERVYNITHHFCAQLVRERRAEMLFDHKEFVEFVMIKTYCNRQQATEVLGRVINIALNSDLAGYKRGFEDGYNKAQDKIEDLETTIDLLQHGGL